MKIYAIIRLYNSFYLLESCNILVYFLFCFFLTKKENGNVGKSQWTTTSWLSSSFVYIPQLHVMDWWSVSPQVQQKLHYNFHPVFSLHRSAATRVCCSPMNELRLPGSTEREENRALHLLSKLLVCGRLTFLKPHPDFRDLPRLAAEWLNSWVPIYCTLPTLHQVSAWALWWEHKPKKRRIEHGESMSIITAFCSSLCWSYRTASR